MVESNFYKSPTNERSVRTLELSPGFEFIYQTKESKISAIASFNITAYEDLSSVPAGMAGSDENDYVGHKAALSADTRLFTRIKTGIKASRVNTRDPSEQELLNNSTDVNKYAITRITPWFRYQISDRLSTRFEYDNIDIDYSETLEEDSSQSGGKVSLSYELNQIARLGLEYALWKKEYDLTTSDYTSMAYKATYSSQFKYFELAGGAGYHEREFDQADLNDIDFIFWDISIKGQNPPELKTGERPRSYMNLSFSQDFNGTGSGNEYFQADRISLMFGHLFLEKLDARIESYYQKSDYEEGITDRKDDTCFLSASLSYFFREKFGLTLKTGIESRSSTQPDNEYDNAFILFEFTVNHG